MSSVQPPAVALSLRNITKHFGRITALDDVTLEVAKGELHALLGENGAGKTTLMHVAYGMTRPDTGEVIVTTEENAARRRKKGFSSPAEARAHGIGMVHQHFTSIPAFTVAENIALTAGWHETGRAAERRAAEVIGRLRLPLDPSMPAAALSVQLRQRLEIVKALAADAAILLLDEPSAVLAPREVHELLRVVREFADRGGTVVLITHKLPEVLEAADRVTVLRRGKVTFTGGIAGETSQSLARAMIGTDIPQSVAHVGSGGEVLVRGLNLTLHADVPQERSAIVEASFEARAGQIVGIAAIEGSGERELLRAIAGVLDEVHTMAGTLEVTGPVAFVPEDRTTEGVIASFTLTENTALGLLDEGGAWLDWNALRTRTRSLLAEFDIRAEDPDVIAGTLSGGNQQKLILARALARKPRVLVAEDPTRGLDVQATHEIHRQLRAAAISGVAVIMHSSDLDEVLALADRVLVVASGKIRELARDAGRDAIGDAMLGLDPAA